MSEKNEKRKCTSYESIWDIVKTECPFLKHIEVAFLESYSKCASSMDPIVDLSIFPADVLLPIKLFHVEGNVVHCGKLKQLLAAKETQTSDVKFCTTLDKFGRPLIVYDTQRNVGQSYALAKVMTYVSDKEIDPETVYIGEIYDGIPHGKGALYVRHSNGLVLDRDGCFLHGKLRHGAEYYPNEIVAFTGRFTDTGKYYFGHLQDEREKCFWDGYFDDDGLPHGHGWKHYSKPTTKFIGTMNHGVLTFGRIERNNSILYIGNFVDNVYHGAGYEVLSTQVHNQQYVCGNYVNGKLVFGCYTSSKPKCTLNADFFTFFNENVATMYIGHFTQMENNCATPHGSGHVFIEGSALTIVVSGNFVNGYPTGLFSVKKLETCPKAFCAPQRDSEPYTYQLPEDSEQIATISFIGDEQYVEFTDVMNPHISYFGEYDGSDILRYVNGDIECLFIRQGIGFMLVNNKRRVRGRWYSNCLMCISDLLDENEILMWKHEYFDDITNDEEHDFINDWPQVHGFGKVFNTDGVQMYRAYFSHGKLFGLNQVVKQLPCVEIPLTDQEDYIVCTKFRKRQIGICINDPEHKMIMSLKSFLTMMIDQIMKDPLKGSFPALRITKVKFI